MNKLTKFVFLKSFHGLYDGLHTFIWIWESLLEVQNAICDKNCELQKKLVKWSHEKAWIRIRIDFDNWIRIRNCIDFKSWIRIHIETNTDPKHWS